MFFFILVFHFLWIKGYKIDKIFQFYLKFISFNNVLWCRLLCGRIWKAEFKLKWGQLDDSKTRKIVKKSECLTITNWRHKFNLITRQVKNVTIYSLSTIPASFFPWISAHQFHLLFEGTSQEKVGKKKKGKRKWKSRIDEAMAFITCEGSLGMPIRSLKHWTRGVSIRWGGLRWTQRVNELIEKRGRFSYSFDSLGFLRRFIFQSASYVCVLYFRSIAFSQSSILMDFGCLNGWPNRTLHNNRIKS